MAFILQQLLTGEELQTVQAEEVPDAIPCKNPLDLPREMRDIIYYFAAFYHLRDIGPCKTPGLLRASTYFLT